MEWTFVPDIEKEQEPGVVCAMKMVRGCCCYWPIDYDEEKEVYIYPDHDHRKLCRFQDHWEVYDWVEDTRQSVDHCPFCGRELFGIDKK